MDRQVILIVTFASLLSLAGTMIGASIGIIIRTPSKKVIGAINGLASGLMLSIIMLDLIPEAVEKINFFNTITFSIIGIFIIMLIDMLSGNEGRFFSDTHTKAAFMAALGLMLHNFPEGIIMGAGFLANASLGIKMSILIAIHDIPEGIAVSAPLMVSRVKISRILNYAFITAFPTLIGAGVGMYIGNISNIVLGECLAIASGIMLYVVFGQMLPESLRLWDGKTATFSILLGLILGLVITNML
ncbi:MULTISPECIES: ZIP family metal transporter [Clostridium]|uniref:Zinc transporter ZupT n=2 Tax=Clostridium TaxID=1485 RepID=A0A151AP41_9CLOT|nr:MULTISPECIES: ZIP family metal transporter [Clostridium]KYH29393.1 zinc transporter ZupT [Clostridium colicanis DSM 13634]MBE6044071.1 ZIP family metal transporter [Clostridium thermopalmarium]PRR70825.1 Zinc transporter ZupT [Clostridium thermopalmarium DSM 5974]PVZ28749.1 ZIP family zinc transporter [Clostridium thermopalmarium DSM 5974]